MSEQILDLAAEFLVVPARSVKLRVTLRDGSDLHSAKKNALCAVVGSGHIGAPTIGRV
jgi:hypothetical protein